MSAVDRSPASGPAPEPSSELEGLRAERDRLLERAGRLEFERDGYYGEWQSAKNQLRKIRRSPAWPVWLLWLLVWRVLLWPLRKGLTLGAALLGALPRLAAWPYLVADVALERLRARLRPQPAEIPAPKEPPAPAADGSETAPGRPRVLIVMPYSIYPPHHGGAVRLYNLVRTLGSRCELYLLIFSRDGEDPVQRAELEPHCARVDFHRWVPAIERDRWGLQPPNALLFASPVAAGKIRDIVAGHDIHLVQLEYTELGQYLAEVPAGIPSILTEHDIAFRSHARRRRLGFQRRFPEGRAFGSSRADWRRLLRYEVAASRTASQVHAMSADDARFLARYLPDGAARLRVVPNGVDCDHYAPPAGAPPRRGVLYVGNFENLPNVDAIEYLAAEVWPLVRAKLPDARLDVVGANVSDRVRRFDGQDGITVLGELADLRGAYHGHQVMVAPIRAGSGTRLKILEAFAAGIPVVSSTLGAEGIPAEHGRHLLLADTSADFAHEVVRVLGDGALAESLTGAAVVLVRQHYDWSLVAGRLVACYEELLGGLHPRRRDPPRDVLEILEPAPAPTPAGAAPAVSIVVATLNGGERLRRTLAAVAGQDGAPPRELICVDAGSSVDDVEAMRRLGARVLRVDPQRGNRGLVLDIAARHARGSVLVFLDQGAVPADREWLRRLVEPLLAGDAEIAAIQGNILAAPDQGRPFFWEDCGERCGATRETLRWLDAHRGVSLSTVNCAISRRLWQRYPFGWAPILEGKKWQRELAALGHTIQAAPAAAIHLAADHDRRALAHRFRSEGYGWYTLGVRYSLGDALRDMLRPGVALTLLGGIARGRVRSSSELLYPWSRPLNLWWGNRFSSDLAR
jgi:glycosyltransferase involved in cell wall biosynthesis